MENSPPKITSSDGTVWSEFPGHDPLRSPISSTGGNTYINASASGHSRQVVGNFTTTLTGNVEKAEVNYYGDQPQLYRSLPSAMGASFDSYEMQHKPTCLKNTRVDLLHTIYNWADEQDERHIFWLSGMAGTGKSTIARTVAHEYSKQKRLGASFFFSTGDGDVGHARKFVTSIAGQLADNSPPLQHCISEAIRVRSDIADKSLWDQWSQLVLRPLSKLHSSSYPSSCVLVVDALDECDDEKNIWIIIRLLSEIQSLQTVRLRVFLTSRPEISIRYGFYQLPEPKHHNFVLHNISSTIVDHDITVFLENEFGVIRQQRALDGSWPGEHVIKRLVESASGLFLWAETACLFVRKGKRFAKKRLAIILEGSSTTVSPPEQKLNEIYITVLKNSISLDCTDEEKEESYAILRHVLGSIVALLSPLSICSLSKLLRIPEKDVDETLEDLHAILDIPEDRVRPLRLHHPSFRDFLLNKTRCGDPNFNMDEEQAHQTLADNCIQLMSTSFTRDDICCVDAPGTLVIDVERSRVEQYLPPEVQYACLYWVYHLQKSGMQLHDDDQVYEFLEKHLLHWLEALSWMQKLSEGILAISLLESIISTRDCPGLYAFVHDIKQFTLYARPAMEQAPLQVYYSALMFAPTMSIVRGHFEDRRPRWMSRLPHVRKDWGALLQTLEGHSNTVNAVAFSPDGKLASAAYDKTVKLWNAGTGTVMQTLKGHLGLVNAVAFSPLDGKQLATASYDKTVKLWDTDEEEVLQTLEGHSGSVRAIAFSLNGKQLASASEDCTVKIWNAATGAVLQTLRGHSHWVTSVAFSPDSSQLVLASASLDETVKLWHTGTGVLLQTLEGHSDRVRAVAFSPDGKQLASASDDSTVKLWDAGTGAILQTLEGHSNWVMDVAFSPDGKQLASVSQDKTAKLWDAGTGAILQTLEGHSSAIVAVTFAPDGKQLASASQDTTVKLWDTGTGAALQMLRDHSSFVSAVVFSPDGKQLASASSDHTVKLWDSGKRALLKTLKGHSGCVWTVAFSPNGRRLASASEDGTVKLWDAGTGAVLQTLQGHSDMVRAVAFSLDGKQLVSASFEVKLWDTHTGAVLQTHTGHSRSVMSVAFSPDGTQLASASNDKTVKLWDSTGAVQTLWGHSNSVTAVAFSPNGKQLVSASSDKTVRLWDRRTGEMVQIIKVNTFIQSLSFASDGTSLNTNKGLLLIPSSDVFPPPMGWVRGVSVQAQWVIWERENMLWLPRDYRPGAVAVYGNVVAVGSSSGLVSIMEFAF